MNPPIQEYINKTCAELNKCRSMDEYKRILYKYIIMTENVNSSLTKRSFKDALQTDVARHKYSDYIVKNSIKSSIKKIDKIDDFVLENTAISLPVVKKIEDIPPMFQWFNGNSLYKEGIYVCISDGLYARVPFPDVVNASNKVKIVKCKYATLAACAEHKKRIFPSAECMYVHEKEKYNKYGFNFKCRIEDIGRHETFNRDISLINPEDIQRLLMYSLSDCVISAIWYQNVSKNGKLIYTKLDVA